MAERAGEDALAASGFRTRSLGPRAGSLHLSSSGISDIVGSYGSKLLSCQQPIRNRGIARKHNKHHALVGRVTGAWAE